MIKNLSYSLVSLSYGWLGIYSDTGLIELKGTIFAFGRGMRSTECHLGYHVFLNDSSFKSGSRSISKLTLLQLVVVKKKKIIINQKINHKK